MPHELEQLRDRAFREIIEAGDEKSLEGVRVRYLGRTGRISLWSEQMKTLGKEQKPIVGKLLNEARNAVSSAIEERAATLNSEKERDALANIDISLPGTARLSGSVHPLTQILDRSI